MLRQAQHEDLVLSSSKDEADKSVQMSGGITRRLLYQLSYAGRDMVNSRSSRRHGCPQVVSSRAFAGVTDALPGI